MEQLSKQIIKKTFPGNPLRGWLTRRKQEKQLLQWERNGKPAPPPHIIKQRTLEAFAKK
jgi:hypothetical protein